MLFLVYFCVFIVILLHLCVYYFVKGEVIVIGLTWKICVVLCIS